MYETHFGLTARPFAETAEPSTYLPLPSRDAAIRRLRYGLEAGPGPVVAFGPPGAGKTLLARSLAETMGALVLHVAFPAMTAAELMAFLADEMAAPPDASPGLSGSVRRIRSRLTEMNAASERPLLIVDEAHLIEDPAAFEALRLILNFASNGPADLSMILVGGPELILRMPTSLADRMASRCLIGPLSESESASYVLGKLERAGASEPLFDAKALAALHREADGLPRRLNRLADLALLVAYAREEERPNADTVAMAVREFLVDPMAA